MFDGSHQGVDIQKALLPFYRADATRQELERAQAELQEAESTLHARNEALKNAEDKLRELLHQMEITDK